jgi:hypothetical protein
MISRTIPIVLLGLLLPVAIFYACLFIASVSDCNNCVEEEQCAACGGTVAVTALLFVYYGFAAFMSIIGINEIVDTRAGKVYKTGKRAKYSRCTYMCTLIMLAPTVIFYLTVFILALSLPCVLGFTLVGDMILPCNIPIVISFILALYHVALCALAIRGIINVQREKRANYELTAGIITAESISGNEAYKKFVSSS